MSAIPSRSVEVIVRMHESSAIELAKRTVDSGVFVAITTSPDSSTLACKVMRIGSLPDAEEYAALLRAEADEAERKVAEREARCIPPPFKCCGSPNLCGAICQDDA